MTTDDWHRRTARRSIPRLVDADRPWPLRRFALEIPWRIFIGEHVAGVVLTATLVAAIGVFSSLDVLRNKPLATLRAE